MSASLGLVAMLDTELAVDVLCIGSGSAGLAAGIASADAGLKVLVAEPNRGVTASAQSVATHAESWTTALQRQWGIVESNTPTTDYLDELTSSLGPPVLASASGHIPIDTLQTFEQDFDPTAPVPPFYGGELATWARECLAAPFGVLFSRVSPSMLTPARKVDGTSVAIGRIASVPTTRRRGMTVRQWLCELAQESGVTVTQSCSIQELIFHNGRPIGALLNTPEGVRAVKARRGVLLGTSCSSRDDAMAISPMATGGGTSLCLVGRTASRFARLEFLRSAASHSAYVEPGRLGRPPSTARTAMESTAG